MPTLDKHHSSQVVKLLNIGESGSGKTGALASLAKAGYHLWVLDFDNGLDIVANVLRDDTEALRRVTFRTLRDTVTSVNGIPRVKAPVTAYKNAGKTLAVWGAESFTPADVIVVDTLTNMSGAAFNEALALSGRLNQTPQLQDYGWLATSVLNFIDMITASDTYDDEGVLISKGMNCNVIVNTHIRFLSSEGDSEMLRGLPNAKGQEITRNISNFFNTTTLTRTQGQGPAAKRIISTQPQGIVEVKISNPIGTKPTYPIDTGLASLFADILGHGPPPHISATSTHTKET